MKKKFILDILVYGFAPILVCNLAINKNISYIILALIILTFIYSLMTAKNEFRLNVSGIIFTALYICAHIFKQNAESDFIRYIYDTYCFLILSISFIGLTFFDKNIVRQIYSDILRSKGHTKYYIGHCLNRKFINQEFEKILSVINIHLLAITFIRVYSISTYGAQDYLITLDLEKLVCLLFIIAESYMLYKIIRQSQRDKNNKFRKENIRNNTINKDVEEKIIYLNKYKKANK